MRLNQRSIFVWAVLGSAAGVVAQKQGAKLPQFELPERRQAAVVIPPLKVGGSTVEAVRMLNGNVIAGRMVKFDAKDGLTWEADGIEPALRIAAAGIDRVTFKGEAPGAGDQSRVLLAGGTELMGQLVQVDDQSVVIESAIAGRLTLRRNAVKAIAPVTGAGGRPVFNGPKGAKGWFFWNTQKQKERRDPPEPRKKPLAKFEVRDGALVSDGKSAFVGRAVEFPKKMLLEFDVHFEPGAKANDEFALNLNLFSDNFKSHNECRAYSLRLSARGATLARRWMEDGEPVGEPLNGKAKLDLTGAGEHLRFALRTDRAQRQFTLSINGLKVTRWKDTADPEGLGNGLSFTSRMAAPLKISRVRVAEWDGGLPAAIDPKAAVPKQDTLIMTNSDSLKGEFLSAANGKVKIKSEFGEVDLGLEHIALIQFAKVAAAPAKPKGAGWVRAQLKGRGTLAFKLKDWADGKLTVESPDFGTATLDARVIDSLTFNLQAKRAAEPKRKPTKKGVRRLELREKLLEK